MLFANVGRYRRGLDLYPDLISRPTQINEESTRLLRRCVRGFDSGWWYFDVLLERETVVWRAIDDDGSWMHA